MLAACEGPAGADGAAGAQGPTGPAGADGLNGADGADGANGGDGANGDDGVTGPTGPTGPMGSDGADGADGSDGAAGSDGADGADGADGVDGSDGADGADGISDVDWAFEEAPASAFTRVDRQGMPAIATAVIASKDAYNDSDPVDDVAGDFVGEITASVDFLHTALDDDLTGLGLVPCATADCVAAAAPLVVPDTIKVDTLVASGFPNGRLLEDPVIDITLALVLLDLGTHDVSTLIGVNPVANDKPFMVAFPYVASPHE